MAVGGWTPLTIITGLCQSVQFHTKCTVLNRFCAVVASNLCS